MMLSTGTKNVSPAKSDTSCCEHDFIHLSDFDLRYDLLFLLGWGRQILDINIASLGRLIADKL